MIAGDTGGRVYFLRLKNQINATRRGIDLLDCNRLHF
jgi:hypothetical protein